MTGPIAHRAAPSRADVEFRKHVAERLYTTDGIWGPSTKGMAKVDPARLNQRLTDVYEHHTRWAGKNSVDAFSTRIDGRTVYLFQAQGDSATLYDLRDTSGRNLQLGNQRHQKKPLPHSEEPAQPVGDAQWLEFLKEARRFPVQLRDTPLLTGAEVPPRIAAVVEEMKAQKDTYGVSRYVGIDVHHVRVGGRDAYLVIGDMYDAVSERFYDRDGKKLDI